MDFTHTSSRFWLPARSERRVVSCAEGQWKAREGREKLSRSIRVQGRRFTWPRPGPQQSAQCHSLSGICCQVQKSLTKPEQREQPALVCFLHQECKELSTTRYFSATPSETLVYYAFVIARGKTACEVKMPFCFSIMFSTDVVDCVDVWLQGGGLQTSGGGKGN